MESDELARGKARFAVDQGDYVHARKQRDGLYWLVPGPGHRGEVVELCAPATIVPYGRAQGVSKNGACPEHVEPLLKFVAGVGGDSTGPAIGISAEVREAGPAVPR